MRVCGCDPDLNGGFAVIDTQTLEIVSLRLMPLFVPPVKGKRRIDAQGAFELLKEARRVGAEYVALEQAVVKPQISSKGPAMMGSVHTVHQNYGMLRALCEIMFSRSRVIDAWPSTWKKDMGLTSDKNLSLEKAIALYPSHTSLFAKKKNVGLAESLLLARWGAEKVILRSSGVD